MELWSNLRCSGRGYFVVLGAVLVQMTLGTIYTLGNMTPYVTSYLRQHNEPSMTNNHNVWIDAIVIAALGLVMPFGGIIDARLGPRMTGFLGSAIMSFGTAVTYFSVKQSFLLVLLTYGAIFGAGTGIVYISMVAVGMRWFPNNRGVVNGVVLGAFSFGSLIFSLVQTDFLNPNNVSPGKDGYFTDPGVLNRLPNLFLLLGAIYFVVQSVGCLLVKNPKGDFVPHCTDELSLSPREALRTNEFYLFWFSMLLVVQTVTYFNSMYKTFGQTFIKDDHFLAIVGSLCAMSNTAGRIGWGFLIDRFKYKKCMVSLCVHVIAFLLTMQLTINWGKIVFAAWSVLLFLGLGGTYPLICTGVSNTFGPKNAATIYAMVFTQTVVGGPITAVMTQLLSPKIGFNGMFYLLAGLTFISLLITLVMKERSIAVERKMAVIASNTNNE